MISWRGTRNRLLVRVHEAVFRATGGRALKTLVGMDVVMITTRGARSGRPRRTMLTVPARDAGRLVLVASNGGNPREPDWCANLRAHPDVEVTERSRTVRMVASVAEDEERARLWPAVVAAYAGYGRYQERTSRPIPLVLLAPNEDQPTRSR